ncbi:hypothetical protein L2E82_12917 [Cichorium intybus]|uniref:Uncharacterized protein n=1 Tax=Cichorium intybus TaxID=13427 RepID=A0ACB9GGV6_CICIN|nr:hypothetical protein L2E82_12917 [Cichorium intybus]
MSGQSQKLKRVLEKCKAPSTSTIPPTIDDRMPEEMKKILLHSASEVDKQIQSIDEDTKFLEGQRRLLDGKKSWIASKKQEVIEAEKWIKSTKANIDREMDNVLSLGQEITEKSFG